MRIPHPCTKAAKEITRVSHVTGTENVAAAQRASFVTATDVKSLGLHWITASNALRKTRL